MGRNDELTGVEAYGILTAPVAFRKTGCFPAHPTGTGRFPRFFSVKYKKARSSLECSRILSLRFFGHILTGCFFWLGLIFWLFVIVQRPQLKGSVFRVQRILEQRFPFPVDPLIEVPHPA